MNTSEIIRNRILETDKSYFANDNISEFILPNELVPLQEEVAKNIDTLMRSLIIDIDNDHNTKETAQRVARMYINEVFKGRYHPQPRVTDFPNAKNLDELYILGPITVRSACSHHLVPIVGKAWVGILPSDRVIGISKFNRVIDWVMSRPHIQEEAVIMIADELEKLMKPRGIAVLLKATHMCMTWRGVKEHDTQMINSIMRGTFRDDPHLKNEFLTAIKE
jgi:GTP cyclohydrolase I